MTIPTQMLDEIDALRPLSASAQRLISLLGNDDYELEEVVGIVESDPALTARLLKLANSVSFGLGREVNSTLEAVRYAGDKVVTGLALELCAGEVFEKDLPSYACDPGGLWRHSLFVAICAREISKKVSGADTAAVAFTAGLLHDIGKAVLASWLPGSPEDVLPEGARSVEDFSSLERERAGCDHAEVGARIAEHWGLPETLTECLRHHHAPAEAREDLRALVYVVHLADFAAMMSGIGTGVDDLQYRLDDRYHDHVRISPTDLDRIVFAAREEFQKMIESLGGQGE